jgi:hypothetical protein
MTPNSPARMVVVKKEEKELRLRQLIIDGLSALTLADRAANSTPVTLRLVTVSQSTPVARALISLKDELAQANVVARVVVTKPDHSQLRIGQTCSFRLLTDIRCHDAHELLVLGDSATWIGDCMRRDPSVRDSYELHAGSCPDAARLVTVSFEKLWQLSGILQCTDELATFALAGDLAGIPSDGSSPIALTRH